MTEEKKRSICVESTYASTQKCYRPLQFPFIDKKKKKNHNTLVDINEEEKTYYQHLEVVSKYFELLCNLLWGIMEREKML